MAVASVTKITAASPTSFDAAVKEGLARASKGVGQPDAHERTVGVEIELRHLAPALLGAEVTCITRVYHVDGRKVDFQIEAREAERLLARGLHKRAVIRVDNFARQLHK